MKKRIKLVRNLLGSLLLLSSFGLFAQGVDEQYALNDNRPAALSARPKYVFVFVGDGMSYPQVQSAADFLGKDANGIVDKVKASSNPADSPKPGTPSFLSFPVAGSAQTYDATSFAPDSASTATSIFTGHKTHSSSINVDITKKSPIGRLPNSSATRNSGRSASSLRSTSTMPPRPRPMPTRQAARATTRSAWNS